MKKISTAIFLSLLASLSFSGPHYAGGTIKAVSGSLDPKIMLEGSITPSDCDGGSYGWMKFTGGTSTEKHQIYATALTAGITAKNVTVYTNSDGAPCEIYKIEVGLN